MRAALLVTLVAAMPCDARDDGTVGSSTWRAGAPNPMAGYPTDCEIGVIEAKSRVAPPEWADLARRSPIGDDVAAVTCGMLCVTRARSGRFPPWPRTARGRSCLYLSWPLKMPISGRVVM